MVGLRDALNPGERDRFDEWARFQREHNIKAIAESAMVCSIYPGPAGHLDAEYILQTGAAVLMDKPILVLAAHGKRDELPPKLLAVADEVIEISPDEVDLGSPQLAERIAAFARRHVREPAS